MTARTVLFDLDGTLTDPAHGITAALRVAMGACGVEAAAAGPLERFIGPPLQESFTELGLDAAGVAAAIGAYRGYYTEVGLFENHVYPGVPELLGRLRSAGCAVGVATSKPRPLAERIVAHFELDRYLDVELDGRNRHKHQVIAVALAALAALDAGHDVGGGRSRRAGQPRPAGPMDDRPVMVGDRHHDVTGAIRTGLLPVGVTWGYGSRQELLGAGAAHLVDHPDELDAVLLRPG
ncbi:MAG: HAD hydrolase-like protein [Acidimicrobiia bacterium]|nr:HAD hydrolase-like protein [Acidimicrobiia bacterium]